jgi:hypothetical protein
MARVSTRRSALNYISPCSTNTTQVPYRHRPWYLGYIHGVRLHTLLIRLWHASGDAARANRYRLPRIVYLCVFFTVLATAVGQLAIALPEALELSRPAACSAAANSYVLADMHGELGRLRAAGGDGRAHAAWERDAARQGVASRRVEDTPCELGFQSHRAYRVLLRGMVNAMPNLVTLVIFLFPALYKP